MLRKETNVVLPEVSADRFKQAGILDDMEPHIQDALHCYNVLKRNCWKNGHTYLWEKGLRSQLQRSYPGYKVQDWEAMWKFLEKIHAVKRQKKGKWTLVFLYKYWKAESDIVKSLEKLMNREDHDLSCLKDRTGGEEEEEDVAEEDEGKNDEDGSEKMDCHGNMDASSSSVAYGLKGKCSTSSDGVKKIGCHGGKDTSMSVVDVSNGDMSSVCGKLDLSEMCRGIMDQDSSNDESKMESSVAMHEGGTDSPCADNADDDDNIPNDVKPLIDELGVMETQEERDKKNFKDDMCQHAAAKSIRENPFTIISGKGGCGKTHVVCLVLEEYPSYAVTMAAPTGKAASNLRKRCKDIGAFTLHQISFQFTLHLKNMREYETKKRLDDELKEPVFKFKETEILVVDECSMVPITVFAKVLHALLYEAKLKKLVLLGDYRQLPSVEPGNLLSDLYKVFRQYGWSIELTRNHRAESELIVKNATKISEKKMPDFDPRSFQMVELPENQGFDDGKSLVLKGIL